MSSKGTDAFRYFLARDAALDRDAEFSRERIENRYRGDLANDLGNLLHRLVHMIGRYHDGRVPTPGTGTGVPTAHEEAALRSRCEALPPEVFARVDELALSQALARVMSVVGQINGYLERTAPWKEARAGHKERVATILYVASEALRLVSVLLQPVLPERMGELWRRLGWQPPAYLGDALSWGELRSGASVVPGPPLFPREVGEGVP